METEYRIIESPSKRLYAIQKKVETWKSWFLRICAGNNKCLSYKWKVIGKTLYDLNTALSEISYYEAKAKDSKKDYSGWVVVNGSNITVSNPPSKP